MDFSVPEHDLVSQIMNFSASDNWLGAPGMDFSALGYELVLQVMTFSAPDNGLVLWAWILVLWAMNFGLLDPFGAHWRVCWPSQGIQRPPGGSQETRGDKLLTS